MLPIKIMKKILVALSTGLYVSMLILATFVIPKIASAESSLFTSGFESGFVGWASYDVQWAVSSLDAHSGSKRAVVSGDTGADGSVLMKLLNTRGYQDVSLSFWYKVQDALEDADRLYVEWSSDGTAWNQAGEIGAGATDTWNRVRIDLPEEAEDLRLIYFRFRAVLDSADDSVSIDDVALEATAIQALLNVISNVYNKWNGTVPLEDFTILVRGADAVPSEFAASSEGVRVAVEAEDYQVTWKKIVGYRASTSEECVATISLGETKNCMIDFYDLSEHSLNLCSDSIDNDEDGKIDKDDPDCSPFLPQLTVITKVINDDGKRAVAGDFQVHVKLDDNEISSFPGNETGVTMELTPGVFSVSQTAEDPNVLLEYATTADHCEGTLSMGSVVVCQLVNDDIPKDRVPPTITLLGQSTMTLLLETAYVEPGYVVTDNVDQNVAVIVTGAVDQSLPGTYVLKYNATDAAGNVAHEVVRTVIIQNPTDIVPPVIVLYGKANVNIKAGEGYVDAGAYATDNVDGSVRVYAVSNVNTAVAGKYTVKYTAIDAAGNAATPVIRKVNVTASKTGR
jgi:hypothetical protein